MITQQSVSYIRVSAGRQGNSGLGIEVQSDAITRFAAGERSEPIGELVEVETDEGIDVLDRRPKLAVALAHAHKAKASVVMAKLCL